MKVIKDIRLYTSTIENIDGNSLPLGFATKEMNMVARRIVMKLNEHEFSLGDFDHLYINFTTCDVDNGIMLAKRSVDRYHPFYRYYDYHMNESEIEQMLMAKDNEVLLNAIEKVLLLFFSDDLESERIIKDAILKSKEGEKMQVKYKEKSNSKTTATVYLRLFNDGKYHPLLEIKSDNEKVILKDMDPTIDLGTIGNISITSRKVVVNPKKSSLYKTLSPFVCEI